LSKQIRRWPFPIFALALALALLIWPAGSTHSENFVFYLPTVRQVLPLVKLEGAKYLPLMQILNMVGKISGLQEKKNALKVWFGTAQMELRLDERRVRLDRTGVNMQAPARIISGQWMVPVDFLTSVLPKLTPERIEYQEGTDRIFIGDIRPNSYTVRLDQIANGARLTLQFTDKVSVRTAASNGQWVLFLGDRPVEPLEPEHRFQSPYLSELRFDDQDGIPKLVVMPGTDGLNFYPSLAEGGKILLADILKPPPSAPPPATVEKPGAPAAPAASETPGLAGEAPETQPGPPLPAVVLDAAHGGPETGARARDGALEKDLVAQYVARVRLALLATKKYRIVLTRLGDNNPTLEQRETTANLVRPLVFITFHAGNLGSSAPHVVVYNYKFSSGAAPPANEAESLFIPWQLVQQAYLDRSRQLAQILQQQVNQVDGIAASETAELPVRALRSINAPAVAIEVGSFSPALDSAPVNNVDFQQRIANAIVQALDQFQGGKS
jgi:N-acetylmuramoyl-L-alanine amidase